MITNIEKYKKDFVKMPSKYIEEPKTSKDWINNLYYRNNYPQGDFPNYM